MDQKNRYFLQWCVNYGFFLL